MTVVRLRRPDAVLNIGAVIVEESAIVTRENDQRVFGQLEPIKRFQNLANHPIELHDGVAAHSTLAGPFETRMRRAGHVNIVRRHE